MFNWIHSHPHPWHERQGREEWMMMHRRGRGGRPFGGGFPGGFGFDGADFRTGRKLAAGDLQLVLLAVLAQKPSHGYELIKALEERSGGFYSPSPGMIYPALTYLEEVGHATVVAEGAKKLYHISADGLAHLEQHRAAVDAYLAQLDRIGSRMGNVRRAFTGEDTADGAHDGPFGGDPGEAADELWTARRELKAALGARRHARAEERRRIADILRRAILEIARG